MLVRPVALGSKNHYAGEDQQDFTLSTDKNRIYIITKGKGSRGSHTAQAP
jgi:hypothetical protein